MLRHNCEIKYILFLALLKVILVPNNTVAQTLSSPTKEFFTTEEEGLYLPAESGRLKLDLSNSTFGSEYLKLDRLPENIDTKKIKIVGNTVLTGAELEALINIEQSTISKDNLRLLIERINIAYRDRGYITSGVFTEPKLQPNGIIFLPITEGRIEDIKITGLNRLADNYVRRRLFKDQQQILNQERLKQALQLLQINELIENISATVVSGSGIGNNILEVDVQESDPFYVELSLDNLGSPTSGSFRRQLKVNHDNIFGFGDRIYAAYTNTDGRNSLDNLSYSFPLNSRNGTIGLSYSTGKLEVIEEPFAALDIDLSFAGLQVWLRQPVYQTPTQEFALGIGLSRVGTKTTLLDTPFAISRGADGDGELNISSLSFYQDYLKRGRRDRFDLRSQLSFGIDIFDATNNEDAPDSKFFIWRGQTSYLRQVTKDLNLSLKSYWQVSDRPLVDLEQSPRKLFTISAEEETFIMRGYRRNSLQGDNGIFASAELQASVLKIDNLNAVFQLTPFIDFGTAWNNDDLEFENSTLISAGLGMRLLVNDNFRARVDWGIPLVDQDLDRGSLQEDGVTFNLEYRFL